MTTNRRTPPALWLKEFLNANVQDELGIPVKVFMVNEITKSITLPSIIIAPGADEVIPSFNGTKLVSNAFIIDVRANTFDEAETFQRRIITKLNGNGGAERVRDRARISYVDLLKLENAGDSPLFNASLEVSIRY